MTEESATEKPEVTTKRLSNGFIPKFQHKRVIIRLFSGGQTITGTVEGYDAYEILVQTAKGQIVVFKHAIATLEPIEEPKGFKPDR